MASPHASRSDVSNHRKYPKPVSLPRAASETASESSRAFTAHHVEATSVSTTHSSTSRSTTATTASDVVANELEKFRGKFPLYSYSKLRTAANLRGKRNSVFSLGRRVPSLDEMCSWQQSSVLAPTLIDYPTLFAHDKKKATRLRREAKEIFKQICEIMHDERHVVLLPDESSLHILSLLGRAFADELLQSALFCQLIKQTHKNPVREFLVRGWLLLYIALQCFEPAEDLKSILVDHIARRRFFGEQRKMSATRSGKSRSDSQPLMREIEALASADGSKSPLLCTETCALYCFATITIPKFRMSNGLLTRGDAQRVLAGIPLRALTAQHLESISLPMPSTVRRFKSATSGAAYSDTLSPRSQRSSGHLSDHTARGSHRSSLPTPPSVCSVASLSSSHPLNIGPPHSLTHPHNLRSPKTLSNGGAATANRARMHAPPRTQPRPASLRRILSPIDANVGTRISAAGSTTSQRLRMSGSSYTSDNDDFNSAHSQSYRRRVTSHTNDKDTQRERSDLIEIFADVCSSTHTRQRALSHESTFTMREDEDSLGEAPLPLRERVDFKRLSQLSLKEIVSALQTVRILFDPAVDILTLLKQLHATLKSYKGTTQIFSPRALQRSPSRHFALSPKGFAPATSNTRAHDTLYNEDATRLYSLDAPSLSRRSVSRSGLIEEFLFDDLVMGLSDLISSVLSNLAQARGDLLSVLKWAMNNLMEVFSREARTVQLHSSVLESVVRQLVESRVLLSQDSIDQQLAKLVDSFKRLLRALLVSADKSILLLALLSVLRHPRSLCNVPNQFSSASLSKNPSENHDSSTQDLVTKQKTIDETEKIFRVCFTTTCKSFFHGQTPPTTKKERSKSPAGFVSPQLQKRQRRTSVEPTAHFMSPSQHSKSSCVQQSMKGGTGAPSSAVPKPAVSSIKRPSRVSGLKSPRTTAKDFAAVTPRGQTASSKVKPPQASRAKSSNTPAAQRAQGNAAVSPALSNKSNGSNPKSPTSLRHNPKSPATPAHSREALNNAASRRVSVDFSLLFRGFHDYMVEHVPNGDACDATSELVTSTLTRLLRDNRAKARTELKVFECHCEERRSSCAKANGRDCMFSAFVRNVLNKDVSNTSPGNSSAKDRSSHGQQGEGTCSAAAQQLQQALSPKTRTPRRDVYTGNATKVTPSSVESLAKKSAVIKTKVAPDPVLFIPVRVPVPVAVTPRPDRIKSPAAASKLLPPPSLASRLQRVE